MSASFFIAPFLVESFCVTSFFVVSFCVAYFYFYFLLKQSVNSTDNVEEQAERVQQASGRPLNDVQGANWTEQLDILTRSYTQPRGSQNKGVEVVRFLLLLGGPMFDMANATSI